MWIPKLRPLTRPEEFHIRSTHLRRFLMRDLMPFGYLELWENAAGERFTKLRDHKGKRQWMRLMLLTCLNTGETYWKTPNPKKLRVVKKQM